MKISTFNVNSLRARLHIVLPWLTKHQPDVLCLQETKVQDADFPTDELDKTGFEYVFKGQKSYNGVAIFSKSPITNVEFGLHNEPKDEARLIKAEINLVRKPRRGPISRNSASSVKPSFFSNGVNGIVIVNTYVPQGVSPDSEKFQYKLEWFDRLYAFFKKNFKPSDPIIWVGDLNIAPQPIDVYDPDALWGHVCFHPEVQKALVKVLKWGFVDVFRLHCSEAGQYTFWDYRLPGSLKHNLGWRLDHIMATKPLAEKCTACYIDKEPRTANRPSDHTPLIAEFNWRT